MAASWTRTHVRLEDIGSAMAVATIDGELAGVTPSARALLSRLGIGPDLDGAWRLQASLWRELAGTRLGVATQWRPDDESGGCPGCTRYALGERHLLVIMREVSAKQEALRQQLQRQRLEATGRLVAGIVHDLRAPLACIVFNVEALSRDVANARAESVDVERLIRPQVLAEMLDEMRIASNRLRRAIDGLLDFARLGPPVVSDVAVREVFERVSGLLRPALRDGRHLLIVTTQREADWIRGNALVVEQVLVNLILNSIEAATRPSTIELSARVGAEPGRIELFVTDDGPGVPPEVRSRLFEPFFTTKSNGTGVGLTTAREAARGIGGDLRFEPRDRGACFVVELPRGNGGPGGVE